MKKIAYIGAGPASLYGAQALLKNGDYEIKIYDKNDRAGGAIYTGIPTWRMNTSFIDKLENELKEKGVQFFYQTEIGKDLSFQQLRNDNDVVVVAIGAQIENFAGLKPGLGCEAGLSLLYDLNILDKQSFYQENYHQAIVWGGGNVAMDCCRSLRKFIPDVKVFYRRSEEEIPASKKEISDARKEGVEIHFLENIAQLVRDESGKVIGIQADSMELGPKDVSGRASVKAIEGKRHFVATDLVVCAVGQLVDFSGLDEQLKPISKEDHRSTLEGVFISGDALYGPSMIGTAMLDARKCSQEIIQYLK